MLEFPLGLPRDLDSRRERRAFRRVEPSRGPAAFERRTAGRVNAAELALGEAGEGPAGRTRRPAVGGPIGYGLAGPLCAPSDLVAQPVADWGKHVYLGRAHVAHHGSEVARTKRRAAGLFGARVGGSGSSRVEPPRRAARIAVTGLWRDGTPLGFGAGVRLLAVRRAARTSARDTAVDGAGLDRGRLGRRRLAIRGIVATRSGGEEDPQSEQRRTGSRHAAVLSTTWTESPRVAGAPIRLISPGKPSRRTERCGSPPSLSWVS